MDPFIIILALIFAGVAMIAGFVIEEKKYVLLFPIALLEMTVFFILFDLVQATGAGTMVKDLHKLPTCKVLHTITTAPLPDGKTLALISLDGDGTDEKNRRIYELETKPPKIFVKAPDDGEYVSFPNPGKHILRGCPQ